MPHRPYTWERRTAFVRLIYETDEGDEVFFSRHITAAVGPGAPRDHTPRRCQPLRSLVSSTPLVGVRHFTLWYQTLRSSVVV